MKLKYCGLLLTGLLGLNLTGCYIGQVNSGERGIETKWGKIEKSNLKPGLHWSLIPGTDLVKMNVRVKKLEMKNSEADEPDTTDTIYDNSVTILTDNGLPILVEMTVLYNAKPDMIGKIYKEYGKDIVWDNKLVVPSVRDVSSEILGHANIYEMNKNRDKYAKMIIAKLQNKIGKYVNIQQVSIKYIKLPKKIQEAIERKIQMKEEAQKAKFEVLKAKQEAQKAIAIAEGQAKKRKIEVDMKYYQVKKSADAESYKLKEVAKAKSEANKMLAKSLTPELLKLKAIEKWQGQVPKVDGNGKSMTLFVPMK